MVYAFGMYKESGSRGDGANNMLCKWQDAQNSYELHVRRADAVLIKRRGDQLCIAPQQEPRVGEPFGVPRAYPDQYFLYSHR